MTKLLEKAINKTRELPEIEQDAMAMLILDAIDRGAHPAALDEATIAALEESLTQARRGEFASDEEVAALWKRHGLRRRDTRAGRSPISIASSPIWMNEVRRAPRASSMR